MATDVAVLGVKVDPRGAVTGAAKAKKAILGIKDTASRARSAIFSLQGALTAVASAGIVRGLVGTNRQFEKLKISLRTVTDSAEDATEAFNLIQEFAKKAPFSVAELTQSFIKMKALGLEPTAATMQSFANTASAMGKSFDQFTEAVADAITGEFERLKEFGIKSRSEGEKVVFTFRGVSTEIGKNSREIQRYLTEIGNVQFAGAAVAQMDSLDGALSNLGDAFDGLQVAIGEAGLNELFTDLANDVASFTREVEASIRAMTAGGGIFEKGASEWEGAARLFGGLLEGRVSFGDWLTAGPEDVDKLLKEGPDYVAGRRRYGPEERPVLDGGTLDPINVIAQAGPTAQETSDAFSKLLKSINRINPEFRKADDLAQKYVQSQTAIVELVKEYNLTAEQQKVLNDALNFSFKALGEQGKDSSEDIKDSWKDAMESMRGSIEYTITDAIMNFKSLGDVVSSVGNMIASMIVKRTIAAPLTTALIGEEGGDGGLLGSLFSADGGGFTGMGSRSGGVDGKGGFPAILHPNETVVDHTKGQKMGGDVVNVTYSPQVNALDPRTAATVIAQNAPTVVGIIEQAMNRRGRTAFA